MKKVIRSIFLILVITVLAVVMLSGCGVFGKNKAVGIEKIEKSGSEGLVDTYTITMTDGSTSTFTVTNGSNGMNGDGSGAIEDYFIFKLLDDDTYEVRARQSMNMPRRVEIPSSYNGKIVTQISESGFTAGEDVLNYCTDEYVISEGVVRINDCAFMSCKSITSITIPSSVKHIADYVFLECANLTSITLPKDIEYLGYGLFVNSSLTSIIYRGTKTEWETIEKNEGWNDQIGSITVRCNDGDIVIPKGRVWH